MLNRQMTIEGGGRTFKRYFRLVFSLLIVPFLLLVAFSVWYQGREWNAQTRQWLQKELQDRLSVAADRLGDGLTAFVILAKSSHPLRMLMSDREGELKSLSEELDLSQGGFTSLSLLRPDGTVQDSWGENSQLRGRRFTEQSLLRKDKLAVENGNVTVREAIVSDGGVTAGYLVGIMPLAALSLTGDGAVFGLKPADDALVAQRGSVCAARDISYGKNIYSVFACGSPRAASLITTKKFILLTVVPLILSICAAAIVARYVAVGLQRPIAELVALTGILKGNTGAYSTPYMKLARRHDEYGVLAESIVCNYVAASEMEREKRRNDCLAAIGQLASHLAHDMRSPLAVLKAYVAASVTGHVADKGEYEGAATRSVEKLLRMADDLVDYAKSSSLEAAEVDLESCVRENAIDEVREQALRRGIGVSLEVPYGILVKLDSYKMGRALVNLLQNSMQAITAARGEIKLAIAVDKRDVLMTISDDGCGIGAEHLPHVFEQFYTFGKKRGTGLGLAYCKQVIEAHGGTIEVESEVGKGTTFTIRIPNCVVQAKAEAKVEAVGPQAEVEVKVEDVGPSLPERLLPIAFSGRRFLLVDDDADIRRRWRAMIEKHGGSVVAEHGSGEQLMQHHHVCCDAADVAIVDYCYPDSEMNGLDVIRYLRYQGLREIHLSTGYSDRDEIRRAALAAGATSVLGKELV